ncbi:HAMP domain-containing sensor histidine kinase [Sporosarcina sp. P33]|uniref:HAMP domain-containing sensor histidine kinase n=1 Tax=Sporosarcina sp. P33 TaxID=1930764 RepID=UPI0009C02328|nr:HAMP domain-containing sensor histidine kinase [Sporosarcina sp. P33]ARD47546.1 two-component sensor histidine kinase [Sporosarcina sp. P33]
MNKISKKLAAYFIISFLVLETILMMYLHQNIIHTRVDEEYSRLLATGSNHRNVLIDYYSDETVTHIILMESEGDRGVVITGKNGKIIRSSDAKLETLLPSLSFLQNPTVQKDQVIKPDWEDSPYIISAHPYKVDENNSGYVLMFQSTEPIEQLVRKLNFHFGLAGVAIIIILFIIYSILSKFLTRPLIRMKEATEKLSEGKFDVSLPAGGNDELGELSIAIRKLANDLERMKKDRNEFLASISHELSTPLTYLIGYLKVAMRHELSEEERNHYLMIIAEESNRMKDLVKNLMDLAKMDELAFLVSKSNFSSRKFADDIYRLVQPSFALKNVHLDLIANKDFQIHADPVRLEQVVLNLLDNALKYSNENTTVKFIISKEQKRTVITVADEGIGIPEEQIDMIFEKLFRVEKSRSRTFGGSGLGLAIVKELVEAHGGSIEVKSEFGKGSEFTIKI